MYALKELERLSISKPKITRRILIKLWLDRFNTWSTKASIHRKVASPICHRKVFAMHRFDIGTNNDLKVKLTPIDDRAAYSRSIPAPLKLKETILVELALLHKCGIVTKPPFSKCASPTFAQRKPNGKFRLLVDLRNITKHISEGYINNHHPFGTLADVAQHMAGKKHFANWIVHKRITAYNWLTKDQ